ncbi:PREDICTED: fatty acid-binding protein, muscle-like [Diuraphis noxia]|uniref:fatty acid-binding protein, muscle-like n=1 Tax=Diuraphis noxia TaxID=143948 RepID=UPI000763AA10|nr:PREDICTED: fatty acid-binding protein, muscle-like [Diuraphis noxia]
MSLIFNKKFKLESSDNFDEYCKALGVISVMRSMAKVMSPVVELTKKQDGKYVLTCNTMIRNTLIEFNLGEEFDEETLDAHKVRSIITQEGNKLVHIQKRCGDRKETTIIREFEPDQMKMTLTADQVTCTRIFKPVK